MFDLNDKIKWPDVDDSNTGMLLKLSEKCLKADSNWKNKHDWIVGFKRAVESRDMVATNKGYLAITCMIRELLAETAAFSDHEEMLQGIFRCSAWAADGFILLAFYFTNAMLIAITSVNDDTKQEAVAIARERSNTSMATNKKQAPRLRRVKTNAINQEATAAEGELADMFKMFDGNSDGKLNAQELAKGLNFVDPHGEWTVDSVSSLMNMSSSTDAQGLRAINLSEFGRVMNMVERRKTSCLQGPVAVKPQPTTSKTSGGGGCCVVL